MLESARFVIWRIRWLISGDNWTMNGHEAKNRYDCIQALILYLYYYYGLSGGWTLFITKMKVYAIQVAGFGCQLFPCICKRRGMIRPFIPISLSGVGFKWCAFLEYDLFCTNISLLLKATLNCKPSIRPYPVCGIWRSFLVMLEMFIRELVLYAAKQFSKRQLWCRELFPVL